MANSLLHHLSFDSTLPTDFFSMCSSSPLISWHHNGATFSFSLPHRLTIFLLPYTLYTFVVACFQNDSCVVVTTLCRPLPSKRNRDDPCKPIGCHGHDSMWLLRLHHKSCEASYFVLSYITHSAGIQLTHCEYTNESTLWGGPCGKERRLPVNTLCE